MVRTAFFKFQKEEKAQLAIMNKELRVSTCTGTCILKMLFFSLLDPCTCVFSGITYSRTSFERPPHF